MKKFITPAVFCVVVSLAFVSCSKDDGDDPSSGSKPSSSLVKETAKLSDFGGVRLIKIEGSGNSSFEYNDEGAIVNVNNEYSELSIDYKKGIAILEERGLIQKCPIKLDKQGRLASLSYSGDEDGERTDLKYTFSYNEAGHLTKIAYHSEVVGGDWVFDDINVYTWEGDLLTKCVNTSKEMQGSDVSTDTHSITYTYTDAADNTYMQYTKTMTDFMSVDSNFSSLLCIGIMGQGPAKYPTSITTDYGTFDIVYTLNSRNMVEREDSKACSYFYIYSDSTNQ